MPGPTRLPNSANSLALDVATSRVESLKAFSGLAMEADIILDTSGPARVQRKRLSNFRWTTGKATVGMGMGKGMYQWIHRSFDGAFEPASGTLVMGDSNHKAQSRLNFEDAVLTSVTIPKLDGSSKDAAYFNVEFEPGRVTYSKAAGEDIRAKVDTKRKAWLCSNFRIEIGSLPCARVTSVESFTWRFIPSLDPTGTAHRSSQFAGRVSVPDLTLAISMVDHTAWAEAAKKWFIDGEHTEANELSGRIVFLAPNLRDEFGEISLQNVGFKKFSLINPEVTSESIPRFNVELFVGRLAFKINAYAA